ncbi:hypothetical protein INS49_014119 [Diaporthe citri]|uniref:uncharacterized protein n=1 Tax=Diaporthe citri TaxID=83186 RepID=UPI001C818318|nr:uncharacterized protein INS49_014119 [Diaporthe citri]KAG6358235.1 hypothetical protein INS49_014119 [Diaporthe citri]
MSGYNELFDFNTPIGTAEPAPTMDQPGSWTAAPSASSGPMEGGTAAQLHARLDLAPFAAARSSGCAECLASFPTDSALHQHTKAAEHQAYKCACGTDFNKHSALRRHIDTKDAPKTFACNLCDDSFTRKDKLKDHCRHYHKVKDEGLRFLFNSQELKARPDKHKAYLCTCMKAFTKLSALRRHSEESTQAREHQCPLCDNDFKRPGHVEQHLRLVHKKPNDVIKDLLSAQKSQPRRESGPASTASTAVPTTGYVDVQADHAIANPGEPWTGPIDFPATAPADCPSSRPVQSSAFFSDFSAPGSGHMTEATTFAPQSFMTQAPDLPAYAAHQAGVVAVQAGFPANPAPGFVGFPAAPFDGNLDLFKENPALISVNPVDGIEMPALGNDFMWGPFGSDFNNFDL